jgi:enoyl-CoA hydratase/carnithine racemase
MASYETVAVSRDGNVGVVELNRPERLNAVSSQMARDLPLAFTDVAADPEVRAVVLCGAGRAFCSGADLKDPEVHAGTGIVDHLNAPDTDIIEAVGRCPKPVIAAIHGYCVGGGVEMVLASDFAVAAPDAILFLSQVAIGIIPAGGGISRLVHKISSQWASRMVLTAERIDADTAARVGLVTEVAENGRERAMELAATVAEHPLEALLLAKQSLQDVYDVPLSVALKMDRYRVYPLFADQH